LLTSRAKDSLRRAIERHGYQVRRTAPEALADLSPAVTEICALVRPYTQTSPERVAAMCAAVDYVSRHDVAGDVVECGVWRGGTMAAAAMTLRDLGDTARTLWLYDTFNGMTKPTAADVDIHGTAMSEGWSADFEGEELQPGVEELMRSTGYPRLRFVRGPVEDTIPTHVPDRIAVLRLDTDWYESTRHELEQLWPRLSVGGVLIVDDYGHFAGARQAVDEFFAGTRVFLHRIDYTGRAAIKQGPRSDVRRDEARLREWGRRAGDGWGRRASDSALR
jgi:hypothetical protein